MEAKLAGTLRGTRQGSVGEAEGGMKGWTDGGREGGSAAMRTCSATIVQLSNLIWLPSVSPPLKHAGMMDIESEREREREG